MRKNIIALISILTLFSNEINAKRIKVHIVGTDFKKNEVFTFQFDSLQFIKKVKKQTTGFAFYINVPDSIQDGDRIRLTVFRKSRFSLRHINCEVMVNYDSSKKYLIFKRDEHLKNKYSFYVIWSDKPLIFRAPFYESDFINEEAKMDKIEAVPNWKSHKELIDRFGIK